MSSVTATITAKMSPVIKRETPAAISPILEPLSDSEEEADIVIHCECNVHGYILHVTFTTIGAYIEQYVHVHVEHTVLYENHENMNVIV